MTVFLLLLFDPKQTSKRQRLFCIIEGVSNYNFSFVVVWALLNKAIYRPGINI